MKRLPIALLALTLAILVHALLPRYTWRQERGAFVRVDRWSGQSVIGDFGEGGRRVDIGEFRAQRAKAESGKAWDKRFNEILLEVAQKAADDAKEEASNAHNDARDALEIVAHLKSGAAVPDLTANAVYVQAVEQLTSERAAASAK